MILLYVVDIFGKYSWVFLLKDKKGIITVNVFQSISTNSKKKTKKIWIVQGSKFCNNSF